MKQLAAAFSMLAGCILPAAAGALEISEAWATPGEKSADLPVYLTISNSGDADDLLRFQCPSVAYFTERRTTDYGEGAPSSREVKSIAISASSTTELKPGGDYLVLLKIIAAAKEGDTFTCTVSFRKAGRQIVDVTVRKF